MQGFVVQHLITKEYTTIKGKTWEQALANAGLNVWDYRFVTRFPA